MVTGKDVVEEKHHPDLCQSDHASAHDLHLSSHHASCKVLSPRSIVDVLWPPHQILRPDFFSRCTHNAAPRLGPTDAPGTG